MFKKIKCSKYILSNFFRELFARLLVITHAIALVVEFHRDEIYFKIVVSIGILLMVAESVSSLLKRKRIEQTWLIILVFFLN